MNFHIVTILPEAFDSYLNESILARAQKSKLLNVSFYNPRDYVKVTGENAKKDMPYRRVDDRPYGGGPGMVLEPEPMVKAIEKALTKIKKNKKAKVKIINFAPGGAKFTTDYAKTASTKYTDIILLCGRYEGIDARVDKIFKTESISIGDYVVTGGELPAMIVIDCVARQIEGVLGNFNSREEERVASPEVYTRPEVFKYKGKKYAVPKVLLSGDHKQIEEWRGKQLTK